MVERRFMVKDDLGKFRSGEPVQKENATAGKDTAWLLSIPLTYTATQY